MNWRIVIRMEDREDTFEIEALKRYEAIVKAVSQFLTRYSLPGRPYHYIYGKNKNLMEIETKCEIDARVGGRVGYD